MDGDSDNQQNDQLPDILKNFLTDVYACAFPPSMDKKLIFETRKALNLIVLENIKFYEDISEKAGSDLPGDATPERDAYSPPPRQDRDERNAYSPPPRSSSPRRDREFERGKSYDRGGQAPSRNSGRPAVDNARSDYSRPAGRSSSALGRPTSPRRATSSRSRNSNYNPITGVASPTYASSSSRTGSRQYNRRRPDSGIFNGQDSGRDSRMGGRNDRNEGVMPLQLEDYDSPHSPERGDKNRRVSCSNQPLSPERQMYNSNRSAFVQSRRRNQTSNIF